jgi:multiple antibiotic resistance protein
MYPNLEFAAISFSLIFFIVDPLGNAPIFLSITAGKSPAERNRTALRASLVTFLILLIFAFVGEWILKLLRVTISSFQIAGGILIFIIALSMLQARRSRAKSTPREEHEKHEGEDVAVFPLAIPMLSGPAAITTVMVLINLSTSLTQRALVILAIFLTCLLTYLILRASGRVLNLLGQTGINVLTRLMGLLLAVISVQFVIDGIKEVFLRIACGRS